jgi:hypothetical protein
LPALILPGADVADSCGRQELMRMESTGMMLALMDIPADSTEEYNRWYDLDHLPEHVAKPDVIMGRRYVAPGVLRAEPGVIPSELLGGYPPYLTTYWFGGPLDMLSEEARGGWLGLDRNLVKGGRFWRPGRSLYAARWRVSSSHTRPDCRVSQRAVPYLAHRGVIVALGRALSGDRLAEAAGWWDAVHLPDLFSVPGLLGAVRLHSPDGEQSDLVAHLLLCDKAPETVLRGLEQAKRYWTAVGRYPAHGGVYEALAFLAYQRIVPLEYDFDISQPG